MQGEGNNHDDIPDLPIGERDFQKGLLTMRNLAIKYGPSMDDLRIALEENRKKYEKEYKLGETDEEIRKYIGLKKEIEDLESLLFNYEHMSPEDKKRMDLELEGLIEQNPEG